MTGRVSGHAIRWFVWAGLDLIPRTRRMRGTWGYDVVCECGWATHTGGALRRYVERRVDEHKYDVTHP